MYKNLFHPVPEDQTQIVSILVLMELCIKTLGMTSLVD